MSKKSAFSHQKEIEQKNEFEEKDEKEEEENEDEDDNPNNNNNNKISNIKIEDKQKDKEKNIHQDPFDISDDEDEVEDKISDLNAIPNFFEIPKPVNLFNLRIKL